MKNNKKPLLLCILDGYGIGKKYPGNAIELAKKPFIDYLFKTYPNILLSASEKSVGLPPHQPGNSEVGHLNIGSGRIVYQTITKISEEIENKSFYQNPALYKIYDYCKQNNDTIHIMGIISDGGIHGHIDHFIAFIKWAVGHLFENIYLHLITDGRDTDPKSGYLFVKKIVDYISTFKHVSIHIASISGRFYTMDRDRRWERVLKGYEAICGTSKNTFTDVLSYVKESYEKNITDEFIEPAINKNIHFGLTKGDGLIVSNYRKDRVIEILSAITNDEYEFNKNYHFLSKNIFLLTIKNFQSTCKINAFLYPDEQLSYNFSEVISNFGLNQLKIAETEKYAHVTFYFNGGLDIVYKNEDRILIPSPKVRTYDLKPEMSLPELTEKLLAQIDKNFYDVIVLNIANSDMVGHTGNLAAAIKAIEAIDHYLEKIYQKIKEKDGILVLTADHGNSDVMLTDDNRPVTSHSLNPVPFLITDKKLQFSKEFGKLSDIAPSCLFLLDILIPEKMTGDNLIFFKYWYRR
ncbi:phosphoglycerate mutase (2,3-diphosphoglycerate-independent) [symbiont of Argiope bruennichi]|uniref:2,3-bisphosphoglycerate-independent phosphoglycerate mutase n=1 Tax=symbiont of Argiope bruennichi TaxID=2810479 RepID=UPI003DA6B41B